MAINNHTLKQCQDQELIAMARNGNSAAFGELWERYYETSVAMLRPFAYADADCIVSEAFTAVWQQLLKGGGPATHFRAYIVSTAKRLAYRRHRDSQRFLWDEEVDPQFTEGVEDVYRHIEVRDQIAAALHALPNRWAEALWMCMVEEKSRADMCEHFHLTPNAMSVLTHRARKGFIREFTRINAS